MSIRKMFVKDKKKFVSFIGNLMREGLDFSSKALCFLLCLAGVVFGQDVTTENTEDRFPYESCFLSGNVSYRVSPFSLTIHTEVDGMRTTEMQEHGTNYLSRSGAGNDKERIDTNNAVERRKSSGISGSVGGALEGRASWSLMGGPDVGAKISTKASGEVRGSSDKSETRSIGVKNESIRESSVRNYHSYGEGFLVIDEPMMRYGNFRLKFSVTLQGVDLSERFEFRKKAGKQACVDLKGLSRTIKIPYKGDDFSLVKNYELTFDYEIKDRRLLEELVDLYNKRLLDEKLHVRINGSDFELKSKSGKNAFIETEIETQRNPHTLFSVDYEPVSSFSPWVIKHRILVNGRKQQVTLYEALKAMNKKINLEGEAMPESTFEFSGEEKKLIAVNENEVGKFIKAESDKGREYYEILGMKVDNNYYFSIDSFLLEA